MATKPRLKITSRMVKSSKCIGCWRSRSLKCVDKPDRFDDGHLCKFCYAQRLDEKSKLLSQLFDTVVSCVRAYDDRHNKLYQTADEYDYCEWRVACHKVLAECKVKLMQLFDCREADKLKLIQKQYEEEYFGKAKTK